MLKLVIKLLFQLQKLRRCFLTAGDYIYVYFPDKNKYIKMQISFRGRYYFKVKLPQDFDCEEINNDIVVDNDFKYVPYIKTKEKTK